jgi:hypothetical protein
MQPCKHTQIEEYDDFDWCKKCGALAFHDNGPGTPYEQYQRRWERCIVPKNEGVKMKACGLNPKYEDDR